jgi:hypothetical protein
MQIPWGSLDWLVKKLSVTNWSYLGCIAPESRSLCAIAAVSGRIKQAKFARIFDSIAPHESLEKRILDQRTLEANKLGVGSDQISDYSLLDDLDTIADLFDTALNSTDSIVIDITSFPKRWFFPIVRFAMSSTSAKNVVVCYTAGHTYASTLSSNPEIVRAIPAFALTQPRKSCDVALIGVGYHDFGIIDLLKLEAPRSVRLLFPFPPGPPEMSRNWKSVMRLERITKSQTQTEGGIESDLSYFQIHALDIPQCFSAIKGFTDDGKKKALLAPYGPKTSSLAMCLYSLACENSGLEEVPAYYSQPTRYALDYTAAPLLKNGLPQIAAYPIKLGGNALYKL